MRLLFFASIIMMTLIVSCKKNDTENSLTIKPGTYAGTFQRQLSSGGPISNVTIDLSTNTWSGQSQYAKYPALCHGTYKINGTTSISFENDCPWTAEFDWTFILSGDYKLIASDNTLEFSKEYNGAFRDVYKLKKQ